MPTRSRLLRLLTPLLAVLLIGPPSLAEAATPSRKKAIWGPVRVDGASQFPIYRELGVGIYQYQLSWSATAPTRPANPRDPSDPAYRWPEELDFATREAQRYGIRVALMVMRTPKWANGGRPDNVPPERTSDYADFLEAAAKRYGGVRHWLIYGEPLRRVNFFLSDKDTKRGLTPEQRGNVRTYAELLDAAYVRLKRVNRRNLVIGGNTATVGDFFGPFNWIRAMRLKNGRPPRMDMFGHNPFSSRTPDLRKKQLSPDTADFSDLDLPARWLDRYLARGGRNRKLPIFISEYTAPTDVPSFEFPFHVTRELQAKWLTAGLRIVRRSKRIYTFGWIGLRDRSRDDKGRESRTGLIDAENRRKPAFSAYKRG